MPQTVNQNQPIKKRNHFISYIKGYAIIAVILIHLIDWTNTAIGFSGNWLKELLYPGVFFFMSTAGSVVYIAYAKSETWGKPAFKLFKRGLSLFFVYYLYNLIKLFVYDFSVEPFYDGFIAAKMFTWQNILLLKTFTVPISILLTIGALISLSPVLLFITKKVKFPNFFIGLILVELSYFAYFANPSSALSDFLFSKNTVMFPMALWSLPFVLGYQVAAFGFENRKQVWLALFLPLTLIFGYLAYTQGQELKPSHFMYPLRAFYIFASLLFMTVLFYLFGWLEQIKSRFMKNILAVTRFLGDDTLSVYIWHWVVIDLSIWFFSPNIKWLFATVPLFLAFYLIIKRKSLQIYLDNQV